MVIEFAAMVIAVLVRCLLILVVENYINVLIASNLFWAIGFGLFVVKYFWVLTQPRVDGKPG